MGEWRRKTKFAHYFVDGEESSRCGHAFRVETALAGRALKCSHCQDYLRIDAKSFDVAVERAKEQAMTGEMREMTLDEVIENLPRKHGAPAPTHKAAVELANLRRERDEARGVAARWEQEANVQAKRSQVRRRERDNWHELCEEHIRADLAKEGEGIPPVLIPATTLAMSQECLYETERELNKWEARAERLTVVGQALVNTTPGEWSVVVDGQLFHDLENALAADGESVKEPSVKRPSATERAMESVAKADAALAADKGKTP